MAKRTCSAAPGAQKDSLGGLLKTIAVETARVRKRSRDYSDEERFLVLQSSMLDADTYGFLALYASDLCPLTFSAVGPRARLLVELQSLVGGSRGRLRLRPSGAGFAHVYAPRMANVSDKEVQLKAWWVARTRLPLHLSNFPTSASLAATLPAFNVFTGMQLDQSVTSVALSQHLIRNLRLLELTEAALSSLQSCAAQMSNLQSLSVSAATPAVSTVAGRFTSLRSLSLLGTFRTVNLAEFASATRLEKLVVKGDAFVSLPGLPRCIALREADINGKLPSTVMDECGALSTLATLRAQRVAFRLTPYTWRFPTIVELDLTYCTGLTDPSAISALFNLQHLTLCGTDVRTLAGLNACRALREVRCSLCKDLQSVSGLAGAPKLRTLYAPYSGVTDLTGLNACPHLEKVSLMGCFDLRDFSPLAWAPKLRYLYAQMTAAYVLEGLNRCPELAEVWFDECEILQSLSPLRGAPKLRKISALDSGVTALDGLASCPVLREVDLHDCERLKTLAPLAGAPQLHTLNVRGSAVRELGHLSQCPALTVLIVEDCCHLVSLSPLAGAPRLQAIYAMRSGVVNVLGLGGCRSLVSVDVSYCKKIESLSGLAGAQQLRLIDAEYSGVKCLLGLNACPSLKKVILRGCTSLITIYPLNLMEHVTIIVTEEKQTAGREGRDPLLAETRFSYSTVPALAFWLFA